MHAGTMAGQSRKKQGNPAKITVFSAESEGFHEINRLFACFLYLSYHTGGKSSMKKIAILLFSVVFCFLCLFFPVFSFASSDVSSVEFTEKLHCTSVQLRNLNTGTIVYEKGTTLEVEPIFLTKLVLALMTFESISPVREPLQSSSPPSSSPSSSANSGAQQAAEDQLEIEKARRSSELEAVKITAPDYVFTELTASGSAAPSIRSGETLNALQLLNMLLVTSGSDAAMVLADYLGDGSIPNCIDKMNTRVKQLGTENTFFTNAHGFHDPQQITTVKDIDKVARQLLKDSVFMEIVEQPSYTLEPTNQSDSNRSYKTTNLMMDNTGSGYYYQPIKGIKTGRTDDSGFCFLGYTDWGNVQYLCIAMGAPVRDENNNMIQTNGAFTDTKALCSWAYNNLEIKTIVEENQPVSEVPLKYAWNTDRLLLVSGESFTAIVPKNVEIKSVLLLPDSNIPEEIEAPVEEGQRFGTAKVVYANNELGSVSVVSSLAVERNTMQAISDVVDSIVSSVWILIGIGIIVSAILIYGVIFFLKNHRNRRKVNRHKYRRF